ncbi:hypothetical protein LOK46_10835 [Methylobacterium sp. NMS14P]|uniref:hypothetical protein n=1 Tax=Methylobacterium sp. NMS14P TaxID=2894310 RepID=UPI00235A3785|nr:hypothetical protein [Methylobacterium sp. NMS14P]WCS27285.1 hypothetical protein LOK46_10835 [Methylobacterium sp. NMS14P]
MTLNVPNLDKLIAHLEAQPPERINMAFTSVRQRPLVGECGCILAHSDLLFGDTIGCEAFDPEDVVPNDLYMPDGYFDEGEGVVRYPAHRVIATLKRLRDHYLATGEIVVDWGPEPTAGEPWAAPQAVELTPPALPAEITRLLEPESSALTASEA